MRCLSALVFAGLTLFSADSFLRDDALVHSIESQVRKNQPTRAERLYDEIGWAPDTRSALAAAKKASRPMFLFTYDGDLGTGRC
jgi:hypothetical protein